MLVSSVLEFLLVTDYLKVLLLLPFFSLIMSLTSERIFWIYCFNRGTLVSVNSYYSIFGSAMPVLTAAFSASSLLSPVTIQVLIPVSLANSMKSLTPCYTFCLSPTTVTSSRSYSIESANFSNSSVCYTRLDLSILICSLNLRAYSSSRNFFA